jgi:hypothetical protein
MNYKPIILPLILSFIVVSVAAQNQIYQIKADSVRIFSNCDTAEFVLENRTRNVLNGVLSNKGNGVTEFRKLMIKLNDTLYIIGGDTLNTTAFGKNIYNSNGLIAGDRLVDGNSRNIQFRNNSSYLISNSSRPVIVSRTAMDSVLLNKMNNAGYSPYAGLSVRGTGCDACIQLVSDSAGTCNEGQLIDFITLKPRKDSWLTRAAASNGGLNSNLMGRIILQTKKDIADYSSLSFAIQSDTAYYKDGAYVLYTPGNVGGFTPYPVLALNPSFRHPTLDYNTKMPFAQVNGGLFVGYGRNWYYNSRNANDIIPGVDDVPGYTQPFYETRFSVYADSLPLKMYKLPSLKGNAFLTYSPARTVEGNNVAFEYKDSVYEDIRNYISLKGLTTPSDLNLKENIAFSAFDNEKLLSLAVKDFNYKADENKTCYTGLVAQELRLKVPELVSGTEGHYSIDYLKMVPYLLKIIQDQQKEMTLLKSQFALVNKRVTGHNIIELINHVEQKLQQQQEEMQHLQAQIKK